MGPVIVANRMMDAAAPGQILVSGLVRELVPWPQRFARLKWHEMTSV